MKRFLALVLALAALVGPALAADKQPLKIDTGQIKQFQTGDSVSVANGGTSSTSLTAHGALVGEGTSAPASVTTSTAGLALVSNGAGLDPSWQLPPAGANPLIISPDQIGAAPGVPPTATFCPNTAGEGSLCMRTDTGFLYSMWVPPGAVPARVQQAVSGVGGGYTVTLGATPTIGDYLIAFAFRSGSLPSLAAGWTSIATHNATGATDAYAVLAYHLVTSGDTTTQTPASGTGNSVGSAIIEVSGLDVTNFANSVQASSFTGTSLANGALSTTLTATTSSANTLGVSFGAGTVQSSLNFSVGPIGINSGWTNTSTTNLNSQTWTSQALVSSQAYPSNSSSVTATVSGLSTNSTADGQTQALLLLQPSTDSLTTGFQPVSYLTTVKSAGSTITAMGRSLNFTSGLSATADADQNITVSGVSAANPTATASDTAVNGSAATFMRSDAAPAVQKASASVFGIVKVDGTSITATGGVISAPGSGGGSVTSVTCGNTTITTTGGCTGVLIAVQRFSTHQTVTPTFNANTNSIVIKLLGAGGGGRSVAAPGASNIAIGEAGGGGGYCEKLISGRSNFVGKQLIVGTAGTGGAAASAPNSGGNGGDTTFDAAGANYKGGGGLGGSGTDVANYGWIVRVLNGGSAANCDLNTTAPYTFNFSTNSATSQPSGLSQGGAAAEPHYGAPGSTQAVLSTAAVQGGDATGNGTGGAGGITFNGNTPLRGGNGTDGYAEIWEYE